MSRKVHFLNNFEYISVIYHSLKPFKCYSVNVERITKLFDYLVNGITV